MKSTGVVRKIDSLGRIVIPKEIRRTLHIRDGEPLEMFTDTDGGIILKKYSMLSEISAFAQQCGNIILNYVHFPILICDRDHVISAVGTAHGEYLNRRITPETEEWMRQRENYISSGKTDFKPVDGMEETAVFISPILVSGDVAGAVILLQNGSESAPDKTDLALVRMTASFIGKQMEE